MKVAFLAAEMAPFAHVGGLGDVARWLPSALAAGGDDVAAFLPHYDVLRGTLPNDFGDGACLATTTDSVALDADRPDDEYYYLVRATTGCGATTGTDSAGALRESMPVCP